MAVHRDDGDRNDGATNDAQLVEALRRGEEWAFAALVDRYHPSLVRLARVYVRDDALAADVAQDAWLGFLESLPRFAGRSSLKTWLFSILVNCARSSRRRESRTVPLSMIEHDGSGDDESLPESRYHPYGHRWEGHWADPPDAWPEEHLLRGEVVAMLEAALRELPQSQQAVITLRDVEGWSAVEVCSLLRITEANQRVLLHRARSTVRHRLEGYLRREVDG